MIVEVKYHADIKPLEQTANGDWVDLRAAEDVEIKEGEFKLISLGVSMKLPDGYEAHIVPRSSTFKTWGVIQTNHMGVVDNSYCGDDDVWMFPALCVAPRGFEDEDGIFRPGITRICKGDRICQFRIQKKMRNVKFKTVDKLNDVSRGGFGSTGRK